MVETGFITRAARGSGILAAQSVLNALLGTGLFMYIARILTKEEMGVYGSVNLTYSLAVMIGILGLDYAASRFIPNFIGKGEFVCASLVTKRILVLSSISALVISIAYFISSGSLSEVMLGTKQFTPVFQVASFLVLSSILSSMFSAFIQGLQKFARLALFRLISQIVRVVVSVLLLMGGFGVIAVLAGGAIMAFTFTLLALPISLSWIAKARNGFDPGPSLRTKNLLSFALPMLSYGLISYVLGSVDQFIVLGLIGVTALGVYTVAMTGAGFTSTILGAPLLVTLTPSMSEAHGQSGIENVAGILKLSSRYIALLFIPTTLGLATLSPLALLILAGDRYMEASLPMIILCLGVATSGFTTAITSALIAIGKTRVVMFITLFSSLIGLALSFVLTVPFGITGATSAKALMSLILLLLSIWLGSKVIPIAFDSKAIKGSLIASAVMAIGTYTIASSTGFSLLLLPLYLTLAFVIYSLSLSSMHILTLDDLELMIKMVLGGERIRERARKRLIRSKLLLKVLRRFFGF